MTKILSKICKIMFFIMIINFFYVILYAEDFYYPYPIVFVHGIASSDNMWTIMRDDLRQHFKYGVTSQSVEEYKYPNQISEMNYFIGCDYTSKNNGNISNIAAEDLKRSIDNAIDIMKKYSPNISLEEQKVVIVCHSMGGLVVRSLLHQLPTAYKDKIHRVVFIDTPHLGSPYASVLWLLNERRESGIPPYVIKYSYSAFSSFGIFSTGNVDSAIIYSKLCSSQICINSLLALLDLRGPRPKEMAIEQLRIPASVHYDATYTGLIDTHSVTISKSHSGIETFLGSNNLSLPKDYKTIAGINEQGMDDLLWDVNKILKFKNNFTFPNLSGEDQTLDNAIYPGDGIVTQSSQKGIGGPDYMAYGFHTRVANTDLCIKSVLSAIADPPKIERVYAVPFGSKSEGLGGLYNVIIKVKEYLLADLEIESMDLDGTLIDLHEFRGNGMDPYKPYYKFGKNFLKKRDADSHVKDINKNTIVLEPGEFYVQVYFPDLPGFGSIPNITDYYTLNIKLKNPAGKTKEEHIKIYNTIARAMFDAYIIDVPPYTLPPYNQYPHDTTMKNLYVKGSSSSNMHIQFTIESHNVPYFVLRESDITLDSIGTFQAINYATWNGTDKQGQKVPEFIEYYTRLNIMPENIYAYPEHGDYIMDLPTVNFLGVIRADPTFIQTHRSYSQLAKYDILKRFKQYGYHLKIYNLSADEEPSIETTLSDHGDKTLVAYEFLMPNCLSEGHVAYLNNINNRIRSRISNAVSRIVEIEDNFKAAKEKLTHRAEAAKNQNPHLLQALQEINASKSLINRLENTMPQTCQEIKESLKRLTVDKENQIATILKDANDAMLAIIKEEPSNNFALYQLSE